MSFLVCDSNSGRQSVICEIVCHVVSVYIMDYTSVRLYSTTGDCFIVNSALRDEPHGGVRTHHTPPTSFNPGLETGCLTYCAVAQ